MKAMVYHNYGGPEDLRLEEVPTPQPGDDQVLVKVHTASINSWDWDLLSGKPKIYRLLFGLFRPKHPIMGSDLAGQVEAVGKNVRDLKPGDEVFGDISGSGFGAFAEYALAPGNMLALKPANMSFEQAAAIPQAGVLALQGLRKGKLASGMKVLINGGGGGVGTFAIQLAKLNGAEVTAVDHSEKLELMQSVGADHVMDYTPQDYTKSGHQYDLILEVVANHSIHDFRRALNSNGQCVLVGGTPATIINVLLRGSWGSGKKVSLLAHKPNRGDLDHLKELCTAGKLKPVIDRTYPLSEFPAAMEYFGQGRVKGKLVITI